MSGTCASGGASKPPLMAGSFVYVVLFGMRHNRPALQPVPVGARTISSALQTVDANRVVTAEGRQPGGMVSVSPPAVAAVATLVSGASTGIPASRYLETGLHGH